MSFFGPARSPWRNVPLTWRELSTRESESFGPYGTGYLGEPWHFDTGARVSFRIRDANGGASLMSKMGLNLDEFGDSSQPLADI